MILPRHLLAVSIYLYYIYINVYDDEIEIYLIKTRSVCCLSISLWKGFFSPKKLYTFRFWMFMDI